VKFLYVIPALALASLLAGGCYKSPTTSTGTPGESGATITISSTGVSPSSVSITVGQSVTFVNSDGASHYPLASTAAIACASASTGTITAGQSKVSAAFGTAATCAFYDYLNPSDTRFQGTITIH